MTYVPTIRHPIESWIQDLPDYSWIANVDGDAATARADILGPDTSDPAASGKEIYTKDENLPTAVASIVNHAQKRANFHPGSTEPDQLVGPYHAYLKEIDDCPFFGLLEHNEDAEHFYSKEYELLIKRVLKLFKNVTSMDLKELQNSLEDMGKSVFGAVHSERWKNLFELSSMKMSEPENPKLYVCYTSLRMFHEVSGKSEISEQTYTVKRSSYCILTDKIKANADQLVKLDQKSVDDWLTDGTTPERENARLCFRPRRLKKAS